MVPLVFGSVMGLIITGIVPLVILYVIAKVLAARAGTGLPIFRPTLVLSRFHVSEQAEDGVLVDIVGRPKGLIAWILSLFRMETDTHLTITPTHITLRHSSLRGQKLAFVPLGQVEATVCGHDKNLAILFFGLLYALATLLFAFLPVVLVGLFGVGLNALRPSGYYYRQSEMAQVLGSTAVVAVLALLAAAVGFGICLLIYHFSKRLTIGVSCGEDTIGLSFKRSIIEGVTVDVERVKQMIEILNKRILEAQLHGAAVAPLIEASFAPSAPALAPAPTPAAVPRRASAPAPAPRPAARNQAPTRRPNCGVCGVPLEPDSRFCGTCGTPLA